MRSTENTLALWVSGLLTSDQVTEWAWHEIARLDEPPQELFDLASDGPERCLKRAAHEFPPRPTKLSYVEEFSLRALATSFDSNESVLHFAEWASRHAMGEDLTQPFVNLGYQLDHLLDDCQDRAAAKALVRETLPPLLPQCQVIAAPFNEAAA
jgi:hypothetical protein